MATREVTTPKKTYKKWRTKVAKALMLGVASVWEMQSANTVVCRPKAKKK